MKKPLLVLAVLLFSACSALPAAPGRPTPAPLPVSETSTSGPTATSAATEPASAVTLEPAQTPLPTLQPGQPVALTSLDMVDAAIGWGIESAGHILRTRDGGLTWQNVTPPQGASNGAGFFALDARTAWAKSCDDGTGLCSLLRTTDGGKTWQVHVTQLPPELSYAFMTFENLDYGLAKTYDVGAGHADISVYKTSDGGATWKQIVLTNQPGNPDSVPGAIHICNICGDVFYYSPRGLVTVSGDLASDPGGAVHLSISTDLGKTWHDQALPLPARKFADGSVAPMQPVFFNDGYGVLPFRIVKRTPDYSTLVYDVTAVYTTHDDGRTWHPNSTVLENGASVAFITPQDAFAFCGKALCVTHDAAHTWQTLSTNLNFDRSSSNEHVEQFSFINLSLGWALTVDNDARALWQTSDGGRTWQQLKALLEDPDAAPALARSPNDYVAPDGLVYKTVYDSAHFQVREAYLGSTKNWDRQTFSMPVERVAGPSLDLGLSPTQSRQKDDLCYAQSVLHENAINGSSKSLRGLPPVDESTG